MNEERLNFLVVDDEPHNRRYLRDLIEEFAPGADIQLAPSAQVAGEIFSRGKTDFVFLDIRMPGTNGFEWLASLSDRRFELVFVTAYSEYAIQAIKAGAADYLLKPIKKTEFRQTLHRLIERHQARKAATPVSSPADQYLSQKLTHSHQHGKQWVLLKDILYLRADNSYTILYLANGQKITTSKSMVRYNQQLEAPYFFRIHKSYLVNMAHVQAFSSKGGDVAVMSNGDRLTISRYRLNDFLKLIERSGGLLNI